MDLPTKSTTLAFGADDIEKKVFEELHNVLPAEMLVHITDARSEILSAIKNTLKDIAQMQTNLDTNIPLDRALDYLPDERRQLILSSLRNQTFYTIFDKAHQAVSFVKDGNEIFPTMMLNHVDKYKAAGVLQIASIVLEIIIFLLNCIGLCVIFTTSKMRRVVSILEMSTKALDEIKDIIEEMAKNTSVPHVSRGMVKVLQSMYKHDILKEVLKTALVGHEWLDYIRTAASVLAMVFTGGAALLAKFTIALGNGAEFIQKIVTFAEMSSFSGGISKY